MKQKYAKHVCHLVQIVQPALANVQLVYQVLIDRPFLLVLVMQVTIKTETLV